LVVSATSRPLHPREGSPVPIVQETGGLHGLSEQLWRREILLTPPEVEPRAVHRFAVSSTLSRPRLYTVPRSVMWVALR
jgi:hypothetical protein